ncbi:MAG: hypothetical protein HY923_06435 [Elusimicrobia bacterium]|nr:hypothetical protein [Elusimicrobiota bacterium]
MIRTIEELLECAKRGELVEHRADNVELKENWQQAHGHDLSAFGNRVGPMAKECPQWLIVGVKDDGTLCGYDEPTIRQKELAISQHVNQYLSPTQACIGISPRQAGSAWIIVIGVKNPGALVLWNRSAYKAAGTTSEKMAPEEMMELTVKLPGLADRSAQDSSSEYNAGLVKKFSERLLSERPDITFAGTANITDEILNKTRINGKVTAKILFGETRYRLVYHDANGTPTENHQIAGLYQVLVPEFVERIQDWTKHKLGIDQPPYPPRALKEAFANAVAHAAYYEADGDIVIQAYPDKVSISNLALQESRYFANRWFSSERNTTNRLLMEVLRLSRVVDELGLGKNIIFQEAIKNGQRPPNVEVEPAGAYVRWRLTIHGGHADPIHVRCLERLREKYRDERKALMAHALVLWSGQPVSKIRTYVSGESLPIFAEILNDGYGPIFHLEKEDRIFLRRWARVLVNEGKDSKALTPQEEDDIRNLAYRLRVKNHGGYFSPKVLRGIADMGRPYPRLRAVVKLSS